MKLGHRSRVGLIGTCAVLVALIAIAFSVGGSGSNESAGPAQTALFQRANGLGVAGVPAAVPTPATQFKALHRAAATGAAPLVLAPAQRAPQVASAPELSSTGSAGGSGIASTAGGTVASDSAASSSSISSGSSLAATRIIKNGNLTIRVAKDRVKLVTESLASLATAQDGYVSSSNTSLDTKAPYGEVVLRIPVAHFQDAIDAAEKLGQKVVSLTTSADDVTGKYVDLSARKHALERTRSTYLTILSRARTIGETLAVQQRIDDVQQQIDRLHGQLKLLGNQASYSTLTVDVVPAGVETFASTHHQRHGIDKAWHDSWSRFGRGVNAIVGAIGPIVFALLLLGVLGLIGYGGYRGFRRATGGQAAA